MQAIQIKETGSYDVLEYVDVKRPSPGKGQVLVKTESISVNFSDTMMRRGTYPAMPPLPAILGLECSGVVEAVGEGVTEFQPGQSVVVTGTNGCYAEYVVANTHVVIPVPNELDKDLAAAFLAVYLTAFHMLHTVAKIEEGQTILIYAAAGGVGTALTQLAKLEGVTTIGLTSSAEKAQFAMNQGIDYTINYNTEDVARRVKEISNGKGINVIFNSVAGDTINRDFGVLAPLGQIIWYGMAAGPPQLNMTELLAAGFMDSLGIRTFSVYNILERPELMKPSTDKLLGYMSEGKIKPHIHGRLPLSEAAKAHELLESSAVMGKLILKP